MMILTLQRGTNVKASFDSKGYGEENPTYYVLDTSLFSWWIKDKKIFCCSEDTALHFNVITLDKVADLIISYF